MKSGNIQESFISPPIKKKKSSSIIQGLGNDFLTGGADKQKKKPGVLQPCRGPDIKIAPFSFGTF